MLELQIDISMFKEITIADCINCKPVISELDKVIYHKLLNIIKTIKKTNYLNQNRDEVLEFFLEQALLRISRDSIWLKYQEKYQLTQTYLYTLLKHFLLLQMPEFFNHE